jgi:hypothetical protein
MNTWSTPHYSYNGLEGLAKWSNTLQFSEPAQRFLKDKVYTTYPKGTSGYIEHWNKEKEKSINGVTIDGQSISGYHYFYLNYCPIPLQGSRNAIDFANFWDLDADWFKQIDRAEVLKKYLAALKARRRGFSLKDMVAPVRKLLFERNTMSYLAAYLDTHANKSMAFVKRYLNHINKNTGWYRSRNPNTNDHIKTAYLDSTGIEKGRLNELYKVLLKDNPTKGVGGNCDLFVYEEAGIVPGTQLLDTLEYVKAATEDGDVVNGLIIIYGSVGELEKCQSLKSIFLDPHNNGFMEYDNIWGDETIGNKKCGYFVPEYLCMKPFIDTNGNSLVEEALERIIQKRKEKKKLSSKQYIIYVTQHPIKPSEAFLGRGRSPFPIDKLVQHQLKLESSGEYKYGYGVKLHDDKGNIKQEINHNIRNPFNDYPVDISKQEGSEGSIWIYEPPISKDKIDNLYYQATDSIDQDLAPSSDSLFVTYILKKDPGTLKLSNDNKTEKHYFRNEIVASYIGRRDKAEDCWNQAMYLSMYYGCKNLVENSNLGIINYHYNLNRDYLLQDELDEIKGINPNSVVKRRKGFHPTKEVILAGDDLVNSYFLEVIGYEYKMNEKGEQEVEREILGLERVRDIGLIKECVEYDGDPEKNFDRLTAFRACLLYKNAMEKRVIKINDNKNDPIAQAAKFAESLLSKNRKNQIWEQYHNKTVFKQHPR